MLKNTLVLLACFCSCVWMKSISQMSTEIEDAKEKVILIACGSFSPPTLMHLRMFGKTVVYKINQNHFAEKSKPFCTFLMLKFAIFPVEVARDYLQDVENIDVIGGILSPAHQGYKKEQSVLISNEHRANMSRLALSTSDWIRLSEWEMEQPGWTQTHLVLHYYQVIVEDCHVVD